MYAKLLISQTFLNIYFVEAHINRWLIDKRAARHEWLSN